MASQPGLEWSLRSLRNIDTGAQHFLQNYYGGDDGDKDNAADGDIAEEDQSAYEIFKGSESANATKGKDDSVWATLHAPLCVSLNVYFWSLLAFHLISHQFWQSDRRR